MKLHEPIEGFIYAKYPAGSLTQGFGENPHLYNHICASPGVCLSGGHQGLDIVAPWGTPILNVMSGKVVEAKHSATGFGKHVRIIGDDNYEYTYGHLSEIHCSIGQRVEAGEKIGLMGNTGFVVSGSTPYWAHNPYAGTHLHLQRRKFTPYSGSGSWTISYPSGDRGTIENYDNGFLGGEEIKKKHFQE
jgi:murein DD-endopeptidase MepM/ murein hydrolase activator NlpD